MDYLIVFLVGVLAGGFGGYKWGARVQTAAENIATDVKADVSKA
jgi:hypothetical protein